MAYYLLYVYCDSTRNGLDKGTACEGWNKDMKDCDEYQKILQWDWMGRYPGLDAGKRENSGMEELEALIAKRTRKKRTERATIKKITVITAVFTLVFTALLAVYLITSDQHDLAYDLTVVFSQVHK